MMFKKHLMRSILTRQSHLLWQIKIADILSKNTHGNPRKIKRFINMLLLRKEIADARGFGNFVQLPIMAKMMLAEQFFADEYKTIATLLNEDGCCVQICDLENMLTTLGEIEEESSHTEIVTLTGDRDALTSDDNVREDIHITRWRSKPDFCSWILSDPQLKAVDLRLYFFACKGAEDYFFEQTQNEAIRQLISKLMGSPMAVASVIKEIEDLKTRDAKYVFDVLAPKIQQVGTFFEKPRGIDGIITLVKYHDTLEESLIRLIYILISRLSFIHTFFQGKL